MYGVKNNVKHCGKHQLHELYNYQCCKGTGLQYLTSLAWASVTLLSGASVWLISVTCSTEQQKNNHTLLLHTFSLLQILSVKFSRHASIVQCTLVRCSILTSFSWKWILELDNFPQLMEGNCHEERQSSLLYVFVHLFGLEQTQYTIHNRCLLPSK